MSTITTSTARRYRLFKRMKYAVNVMHFGGWISVGLLIVIIELGIYLYDPGAPLLKQWADLVGPTFWPLLVDAILAMTLTVCLMLSLARPEKIRINRLRLLKGINWTGDTGAWLGLLGTLLGLIMIFTGYNTDLPVQELLASMTQGTGSAIVSSIIGQIIKHFCLTVQDFDDIRTTRGF